MRNAMLFLLAAALCFAQPGKLSIQDVFQIELATDPQISPDGKRIVYVRQFQDIMADQRRSNLWMVNADGTGHRPLTTGSFSDASPRWSPDGTQLAFTSDREGGSQIWRMWIESGQMARVTNVTEAPAGISWSPDGKHLAFTMLVAEAPRSIIKMPAAPEGAKWADPAKVIDKLVYRFNGAGYLKPGYHHVFVVPSEGGTARQITSGRFQHGGVFSASEAVWTPDSKALLLSAVRRPDYELEQRDTDIYEFSVADGSVKELTKRKGPDNGPAVSPDGKLIAYTGFDDRFQGYQVTTLYVMNRDGSSPRTVVPGFDRDVANLRWALDGKGIYFTADSEGNTSLNYTTLDGARRQIAKNAGASVSAYSGGAAFSISKTGAYAMTYARPDVPGDIATGLLAGGAPKVLTAVNEDLFAGKKLGAVEEVWYESSKDKRKIQGWIIKPPDFDPAKKYPLILEIHGGPFANYGDRFDIEKQMMAASGYVVLYTNPRGSTSYGGEFGNLIHHAYPGDDFFDLNSGVDAVIAKGYVDDRQVYVTGGSGGGVLTCWMIGRSTRFRAAVTVYPVINWESFVLTSDIGNWTSTHWFAGLPWDHQENYDKRSLLSVVKNVQTPTMVLCGEEDWRTPMSESEQYYQALKLRGVESVLVRVPGEPHGIRRRPSHEMSKILHIIGWFDQHRAGGASGGQ